MQRLRDADGAALSQLYQRFGRPCYSLARRICADEGLAEDVVQVARVAASQVHAALHRLPVEQRLVIVLAYFGGHTQREIAVLTGVPLGTVKSRMFTAVQRLRSLLTDQLGPDALVAEARMVREVNR